MLGSASNLFDPDQKAHRSSACCLLLPVAADARDFSTGTILTILHVSRIMLSAQESQDIKEEQQPPHLARSHVSHLLHKKIHCHES